MSSRDSILATVKKNQPENNPLPDLGQFASVGEASLQKYTEVLTTIGGQVKQVNSYEEIEAIIAAQYPAPAKIVTTVPELKTLFAEDKLRVGSPLEFHDVALAIVRGNFGVAENGAVWVTEDTMGHRALPFICENLAVIINAKDIVATMHKAYGRIESGYGYGAFIAGPSKTADIEQSLVIGAHGPKSMTVFVLMS